MTKKVVIIAFVAAVALTAGWNLNKVSCVKISDLTLDNVEALAQSELGLQCYLDTYAWTCLPTSGRYGCSPCYH